MQDLTDALRRHLTLEKEDQLKRTGLDVYWEVQCSLSPPPLSAPIGLWAIHTRERYLLAFHTEKEA